MVLTWSGLGHGMLVRTDRQTPVVTHPGLFPFEASSINLVLLTHAHMDHSGNLPNLFREGYEGQILCTEPTFALANVITQGCGFAESKAYQ